jgi:membrane protease YdiL (CAAX protease family)
MAIPAFSSIVPPDRCVSVSNRSSVRRSQAEGVIVLIAAYVLVRAFWLLSSASGRAFDSAVLEATAKAVMWACGCFPVALWIARRHDRRLTSLVGLDRGAVRGFTLGALATLPMLAALFVGERRAFDLDLMFGSGLIGPFAEELLFRGFLFGLLWRGAGWSIAASILASSLLFGLAHVPNADFDLLIMLRGPGPDGYVTSGGVVVQLVSGTTRWWQHVSYRGPAILATALPLVAGGAVLAWIAYRWGSLWPAVALHACMNLWWDATRGEHTVPAPGLDLMSIAQLTSVALAIGLTLRFSASGRTGTSGTTGARNELTLANDP